MEKNMHTISPIEFGKLLQAVETLTDNVEKLSADVETISAQLHRGKGMFAGIMLVCGALGALATIIIKRIFG